MVFAAIFGGLDILAGLNHVTRYGLPLLWVIIVCVEIGETWPSVKVAGLDGLEPCGFD